MELGAVCLGWGGEITLSGKRVAVTHGHLHFDVRPLLAATPDYLLSGHSHLAQDWRHDAVRRINPGSLHDAEVFTVGLLDLSTDKFRLLNVL